MSNMNQNGIYNETLLSYKKEGNPAFCNNVDGPGGQCANRQTGRRKTKTARSHLHVGPKKVGLPEAERGPVCQRVCHTLSVTTHVEFWAP